MAQDTNAVRPSAQIIPLPASNVVRALPRERRIVVFAAGVATGYDSWGELISDIGGQPVATPPAPPPHNPRHEAHRRFLLARQERRRATGRSAAEVCIVLSAVLLCILATVR